MIHSPTFTVTNSGSDSTGPLVTAFTGSQLIFVGHNLCAGVTLDPGGTCTFSITFGELGCPRNSLHGGTFTLGDPLLLARLHVEMACG